jgi:hypothetical protein
MRPAMTLLKQFGLGVLLLAAFSATSQATPFLQFTVGGAATTGGQYTLATSSANGIFDVTAFTYAIFGSMSVSGDFRVANTTYTLDRYVSGTGNVAGAELIWDGNRTLTLNGCFAGTTPLAGLTCTNTAADNLQVLVTMVFGATGSSTALGATTANPTTVGLNTPTSLTDNSTLLADLYLSSPTMFGTGNQVQGSLISGHTYNATSNVLNQSLVQITTPEPISFLLMGCGLLGLAFIKRHKESDPVHPNAARRSLARLYIWRIQ